MLQIIEALVAPGGSFVHFQIIEADDGDGNTVKSCFNRAPPARLKLASRSRRDTLDPQRWMSHADDFLGCKNLPTQIR